MNDILQWLREALEAKGATEIHVADDEVLFVVDGRPFSIAPEAL